MKEKVWGWRTGGREHGHSTEKYADGVNGKEDRDRPVTKVISDQTGQALLGS